MTDNLMFWTDLETTGLSAEEDVILQVSFALTDLNFDVLAQRTWYIWDEDARQLYEEHKAANTYVYQMHVKSGIWEDCRDLGRSNVTVMSEIVGWLTTYDLDSSSDPLCGSSVHFDRAFLKAQIPAVEAMFHYRNIDISSVKELCRRLSPTAFARMPEESGPMDEPLHRAENDVLNTINEARWYSDNFFRREGA